MNTFGQIFTLTTAGESHGPALTGIIDGMPAGVTVTPEFIARQMALRKPGRPDGIGSPRREPDEVEILSGMKDNVTLGTPIGFIIRNRDARSDDYAELEHAYRPSHADFTYQAKYGLRDHRGGGRASARETALRVAAGAFALAALQQMGIRIDAFTSQIGSVVLTHPLSELDLDRITSTSLYCPDPDTNRHMEELLHRVAEAGDTIGGIVTCVIQHLPAGVGQPMYDKLQARLAYAMMSINAAKGFDYGMGFDGVNRLGSETNDPFVTAPDGRITTLTNHSGGIQGGITNGRAVTFRVAFKPIATLMRDTRAISDTGQPVTLHSRGRHDVCALPRAVPVVQAMAAITILDALLLHRSSRIG